VVPKNKNQIFLPFKVSEAIGSMTTNRSIHDYEKRFERFKYNIKLLPNSKISLQFLDHLGALGLSVGSLVKYASHLPILFRIIGDVDLKELTKLMLSVSLLTLTQSKQSLH
jgi:hypothetical protein